MSELTLERWFSEGGIIESFTVLAYVACLILMLVRGGRPFWQRYAYLPVLVAMMAMRELDFDKRFTEVGILKSRFFGSAEVSIQGKLVGLVVLLVLAWAAFNYLRHHVLPFLSRCLPSMRRDRPIVFHLSALILVLVLGSKAIDGLASKIPGLDAQQVVEIGMQLMIIEETAEMAIPFVIAAAFLMWWRPGDQAEVSQKLKRWAALRGVRP